MKNTKQEDMAWQIRTDMEHRSSIPPFTSLKKDNEFVLIMILC